METYVLVQGGNMSTETWNKLSGQNISTEDGHMGARYWDGTVDALKFVGHRVFAPTISDEFSSNLTDHIIQICTLIVEKDLQDIILVGHSYGGFVITGVADRMPERIRLLVYLDSGIPDPGQSLVDALNMVYSKEDYAAAVPDPNPPYAEKLHYDPKRIEGIKKIYIRCMKSEFIDVTRIAKEKVDAAKEGWTYFELPSSHVPMADLPEEFYKLMLEIAKL
ncbi:MAG: alpha/beta hydrolase [Methanobacterium sp.]|nr:alpha/beta hydrolase [Methanobacterium sp.]